jgi:hypothetical protein
MFFDKKRKFKINENIHYEHLNENNYEDAVKIFMEGYYGNPGNPMIKHLKIPRDYTENSVRERLKERI